MTIDWGAFTPASALGAGLVFGLGLILSDMSAPSKVLAFLDLAGDWDPSLAFVMGGAVAVGALAFGAGWGLAGYCPGPALVSLATGGAKPWIFTLSMLAGMGLFEWLEGRP